MKLVNHYYSIVSGLAASLGSLFGKLITYTDDGSVRETFLDVASMLHV